MALRLELAKSGRSTCRICRAPIACSAPRVGLERDDEVFVANHQKSAANARGLPLQWPANLGESIVRMLIEHCKLSMAGQPGGEHSAQALQSSVNYLLLVLYRSI